MPQFVAYWKFVKVDSVWVFVYFLPCFYEVEFSFANIAISLPIGRRKGKLPIIRQS